ncbi:MAG: 1-(5-phosphoribosyl)-5-[(5-phosphoribosylamino) methylideneamino]imidazole-4-carboxamide isomerase [Rhodothermia bacterium]|nr:MAG: 1-(5-phosphoribosyl)-5-[(5-phosphoribosylamino) methylideneamino]imidazole-4-carboxamide isomerase [Rhodothermia bacterium]
MLLVIPAIDLLEEFCVRKDQDAYQRETKYFDDPVKMAKLWRIQNAKALHISGHDAGDTCKRSTLQAICEAVDIPVQLQGGLSSFEVIDSAFEAGVYRVIVEVSSNDSLDFFLRALSKYGPSKTVAGIHAHDGKVRDASDSDAVLLGKELEHSGCKRIVYTDISTEGTLSRENFDAFERMTSALNKTHLTAAGGIAGFEDLMHFVSMQRDGLDSVVIGQALYENRFPCQQSWCWNNKDEIDLTRFSSASLATPR